MSTEVAIREHDAALSLTGDGGPPPAAAVAFARECSTALLDVLSEGNGYKTIQGKKHVTIEGWQMLAAMTQHSIDVEWTRPIDGLEDSRGVKAWEARAVVRDRSGRVVAAGESMADPNEPDAYKKWARGGNFAVRSMAQTRAMSRAAQARLRYIVVLAGFAGAPAEEMGGKSSRADVIAERQAEAERRATALGVTDLAVFFSELGVNHPDRLYTDKIWKKVTDELSAREEAAGIIEGEVVES